MVKLANESTTIKVSKEVQKDLKELRIDNESYSSIIRRLIDEHKGNPYDVRKNAYESTLKHIGVLPNLLTLDGVETLLGSNMFNEVPQLLSYLMPSLIEFKLLATNEVGTYPKEKYDVYVEKSEKLLQRLNAFMNSNDFFDNDDWKTIFIFYINALANMIGKTDEYFIEMN